MTNEQKLKQIMKELKNAEYIGEDGGMVVNCPTALGAYRKMLKRWKEDCGEDSLDDFKEWCKLEDIIPAYLHLVTDTDEEDFDTDCEWSISLNRKSDFVVWCFWE